MIRFAAAAFAFLWFSIAHAQLPQFHAQVFGAEQGIGGGGIADVFKDRQQFLWIVNSSSMQCFDGRNVRTFPFEKNIAQAICDRQNSIWVVSGFQVWRKGDREAGFQPMSLDTTGGVFPRAVFQLRDKPVCVLTDKGVFAWNDKPRQFERLPVSFPKPLAYTSLWRFDTCGTTIFYPGPGCLYACNLATGRVKSLPANFEIPYLSALTPTLVAISDYRSNTWWYDFKAGTIRPIDPYAYRLSEKRSFFGITGVAALEDNRFLITSRIGTYIYDLKVDRFTKQQIYAAGKPVELWDMLTRVKIDENGTAWAHDVNNIIAFNSLSNGAIGLLRNYRFDLPHAWNNRVVGFAEDDRGNLWFGGAGGFRKLHLQTGEISNFPAVEGATNRLSHPSVRGMGFDGRYVILGPTDKGLWLFNPLNGQYKRPVYASDSVRRVSEGDFFDHLAVMRNGDIIACGRFRVYRIEAQTYRMDFLRFPGDASNSNAVTQDADGRIWIGMQNSVYCLPDRRELPFSVPLESVLCLFPETENSLLAGTVKGLRRIVFKPDKPYVENLNLPAEGMIVSSILADSLGRYWLGTTEGLYLANNDFSVFKKFDFADNIQGLVYNGGACIRASNGMAFFGGINGINYFFPEKIPLEDQPLSVSIRSLRINDRDSVRAWQPATVLQLPYRENTLNAEVVAPYFNNAGKVRYRYRLHGRSEAWIPIGVSNQIRLADIPPGEYRLEVAASITGQVWYPAAHLLAFDILPPFWQTWPFRLAASIALVALLAAFIRYRENRLRQKQQAQLELEKLQNANLQYQLQLAQTEEARRQALLQAVDNQRKAAEAKLQSMRLQMNPHFLFNALNSIQQMILSGKDDSAAMYLSKFSKLLRMVLTHSDHEYVSLREEMEMLQLYLDLEALRFDETFEYTLTCADAIDRDEYRVPPLLIQPFVENAIWHGLLHQEGKRLLMIRFEQAAGDRLQCTVEDNGIGREAARAYSRNGGQLGKGLSVGIERIKTLNHQYGQQNSLEIVDLVDEAGMQSGTKILLTLD